MTSLVAVLLGAFFVSTGLAHIARPAPFRAQVPAWVPTPGAVVLATGLAEIVAGVATIVPGTRQGGAIALAVLLVAYIPAHVHVLSSTSAERKHKELVRVPANTVYLALAVFVAALS